MGATDIESVTDRQRVRLRWVLGSTTFRKVLGTVTEIPMRHNFLIFLLVCLVNFHISFVDTTKMEKSIIYILIHFNNCRIKFERLQN
jgi:hypothetical protein